MEHQYPNFRMLMYDPNSILYTSTPTVQYILSDILRITGLKTNKKRLVVIIRGYLRSTPPFNWIGYNNIVRGQLVQLVLLNN